MIDRRSSWRTDGCWTTISSQAAIRFNLWAELCEANVAHVDDVRIAAIEASDEFTVVSGTDKVSEELLMRGTVRLRSSCAPGFVL